MKITVEVGANNGEHTRQLIGDCDKLYSFEPDPDLFQQLTREHFHNPKVNLYPFAVGAENGIHTFNISLVERGINSLYPLHDKILDTALIKYQAYRDGFSRQVQVWTIRMDTFLNFYSIPHVDYMWCDAQGNDIEVLKSFGDRIKDLKAGRIECTYKIPLYQDIDNSEESATRFLQEHGFQVARDYVHENDSEVDLKFWR